MGASQDTIIEAILSGFSKDTEIKGPYETFVRTFMEGVSQANVPLDFVVEQLHSIPKRYQRLETPSSNTISHPDMIIFFPPGGLDSALANAIELQKSGVTVELKENTAEVKNKMSDENEIFTPHGLVDHVALAYYNKFNLFDLLDDKHGYTNLEIGDEKFVIALMRNQPISSLESQGEKLDFQYRLGVWTHDGELVGFRNHYVSEETMITPNYFTVAVKGIGKFIKVDFWGASQGLGLSFEKPTDDGIWVHPDYRRRHIGHTLENIASDFIPKVLDIPYVVAYPGEYILETKEGKFPIKAGSSWVPPNPKAEVAKDFFWVAGYEDDLNPRGMVKRFLNKHFPEINVLPKDYQSISQRLLGQKLEINPDYSPTWQYTMLLNLEQRAR